MITCTKTRTRYDLRNFCFTNRVQYVEQSAYMTLCMQNLLTHLNQD